jgi:hypothetical protein
MRMKSNNKKKCAKVVHIGKIRKEKEEKGSIIALVKDTHKATLAIQDKICLICQTKKLCVNKTGLCASCYNNLNPKEKKVADREAKHKTIEVKVTDDRWEDLEDT